MKSGYIVGMLQNLLLFRGLELDLIRKIAAKVHLVHVDARTVLFKKGDACTGFYVVSYGRIRLSLFSSKGMEKPLQLAGPNHSFGEVTMFQQVPHFTTATALEDSALIFVPQEIVIGMLQSDWRIGMRMLANLSYRIHLLVNDIDEFLLKPPAARLAAYLLRLVPAGSESARDVQLVLKKNLLAAQLNLTPETLSRYFREFADMGLIAIQGSHITIFSPEHLSQYGDEETLLAATARADKPLKISKAKLGLNIAKPRQPEEAALLQESAC